MMQDAHPTLSPIKNKQFCFFSGSLIGPVCVTHNKGARDTLRWGPVSSSQLCFQISRCSGCRGAGFLVAETPFDGNTGHSNAIYPNKHPRGPFANCHIYYTQNPLHQADRFGPSLWLDDKWRTFADEWLKGCSGLAPVDDPAGDAEGCRFLKTANRKRNKNRFFFSPYTF